MKIKENISRFTQTHWLFVAVALVFGVVLISLTPPLWGADECRHFFKAYQISSGQLMSEKQVVNGIEYNDGNVPASFNRLFEVFKKDVTDNSSGSKGQVESFPKYLEVGSVNINNDLKEPNQFGAIIYPPITYVAPATGMFIANLFNPTALSLMYAARIAALLSYIVLTFLALYLVRNLSIKWIIFVIALLPMSLYQASTVSADPLLIGSSLIFMACAYRVVYSGKINKRLLAIMICSAGLLSYIKPPYAFLALPFLFLPLKKEMPIITRRIVRFGIPFLCLAIAVLATVSTTHIATPSSPFATGISGQLSWIISHPLGYLYILANSITICDWIPQMVGIFGTSFIYMPVPVIDTFLVLLVLAAFIKTKPKEIDEEKIRFKKLGGLVFLSAGLLASAAVITALHLACSPIGSTYVWGVQGRYFLPIVGFLLIGLRMLTKARFIVTEKSARIFVTSIVVFSLVYSMLWYYRILY
jgi:uncharacterized membrane protein